MIDFNGMSTIDGYFKELYVYIYAFMQFLDTVILYQVFPSNTNNYMVSINYFYLLIVIFWTLLYVYKYVFTNPFVNVTQVQYLYGV